MARIIGWGTAWRVKMDDDLRRVYARLLATSKGTTSLDESLFTADELWYCRRRHEIEDSDTEQLLELDREFCKSHPAPPDWWKNMVPDAPGRYVSEAVRANEARHRNYARSIQYARDNAVRLK